MTVDQLDLPQTMLEHAYMAGGSYYADTFLGVHPSVWVHPDAVVHRSTVIYPGVYIGPGVTVGQWCVIGPNATIGQPGYGYTRQPDCTLAYRSHRAGVVIEDEVHVGASASVSQGRYRPTRIGRGTKLDAFAHVAHNVEVGRDCLIIALTELGGSATVGDRSQLAPAAAVRDHRNVGADCLVGLGAVVTKDVPDGTTVIGVPAKPVEEKRVSHPCSPDPMTWPLVQVASGGGQSSAQAWEWYAAGGPCAG